MFRSIRWRLVASYVGLTLLTVSSVGVLALSLIEGYVERQEQDYLTANAETLARQALVLMRPVVRPIDLSELAQTASFLGDVQVRILNDRQQVLADSGIRTEVNELVWILTGMHYQSPDSFPGTLIMVLPSEWFEVRGMDHREVVPIPILEQLPPGAEIMVVHRSESPWGSRLTFGSRQRLDWDGTRTFSVTADVAMKEVVEGSGTFRPARTIIVPIGEADEPIGYVELSKGQGFGVEALETARRAFLLAAGGATMLAVIVGLVVSRGLTAPLRELASVTRDMGGGDLSIRAPAGGKDEIGQLARQFNRMAEGLEASFAELAAERDSLRHFIADASHELRTPITVLKSFNELLQGAAVDDPAARVEFLAESQIQLGRLEWITHNLLDLSRLDAGLVALDKANHDVGELISTAAAAFKTLAQEKGITLSIKEPSSLLQVHCDRARIELALSNLVDNGLKFTPAGGQVEIGAGQAGDAVQLWVRDTGGGIDAADLPHVFERFYRGRNGDGEGSGLGLAIVQSIVQAHAGRVTVESEPGAGSRFVIELPV